VLFAGKLASADTLYHVSAEVRRAPPAAEPARPSDLLLDGGAAGFSSWRRS